MAAGQFPAADERGAVVVASWVAWATFQEDTLGAESEIQEAGSFQEEIVEDVAGTSSSSSGSADAAAAAVGVAVGVAVAVAAAVCSVASWGTAVGLVLGPGRTTSLLVEVTEE